MQMEHLKSPLAYLCRRGNGNWWANIWFKGDTKFVHLTPDKVYNWIERASAKGYSIMYREKPEDYIKKEGT